MLTSTDWCGIADVATKMPRLSEGEWWQIVALGTDGGWTQLQLKKHFNCGQSTITKLLAKARQEGYVKYRPRSGRPRATDQQDDALIVREAQNSPFTTAKKIREQLNAQNQRNIST